MRLKNVLPLLRVIHISFLVQGVLLLGNMGLAILLKLLITLLLWTRICESCTMNKVCWLLLVIILCNYHADTSCYHKEANRKEEPKEPLGIVTKIVLIFLVTFTYFIPFISKHGITLRICTCTCAVIHWRSLANSSCIFFESASLTCTDVFNWVGAFSRTLSIFILLFLFAILSNIAQMLNKDRATISGHISNIFKEGELEEKVVCWKFRQTTQHGALEGKTQSKDVKYYNLDVIISVGYHGLLCFYTEPPICFAKSAEIE